MRKKILLCFMLVIVLVMGLVGCKSTDTVTPKINQINTTLDTMQGSIDKLNTSLSAIQSASISKSDYNNVASQVSTLTGQVNTLNNAITDVKSDIAVLNTQSTGTTATQTKITELQTTVKALSDSLATIKSSVDALSKQVTALATPTTTPTTTTTTNAGVIASVIPNIFTGATVINVPAIPFGTSTTQTFTFQIDNGTGVNLTAVSLALALQSYDATGNNLNMPTFMAFNVVSGNPAMVWTSQNTGVGYISGFVSNISNTGVASLFGLITIKPGINTFTQTVTITNNSTASNFSAFLLLPMVKVVSFSK